MITEVKAQDIKIDNVIIFYDDPEGDSDDYTSYRVEVAHPTVVTTMINRYDVIELAYRELETGVLHTRQVHPEYSFRIIRA
jgi:hypothetical protein